MQGATWTGPVELYVTHVIPAGAALSSDANDPGCARPVAPSATERPAFG